MKSATRAEQNLSADVRFHLEEALVEMYLAGVSVRRIQDNTEALWGTHVQSNEFAGSRDLTGEFIRRPFPKRTSVARFATSERDRCWNR